MEGNEKVMSHCCEECGKPNCNCSYEEDLACQGFFDDGDAGRVQPDREGRLVVAIERRRGAMVHLEDELGTGLHAGCGHRGIARLLAQHQQPDRAADRGDRGQARRIAQALLVLDLAPDLIEPVVAGTDIDVEIKETAGSRPAAKADERELGHLRVARGRVLDGGQVRHQRQVVVLHRVSVIGEDGDAVEFQLLAVEQKHGRSPWSEVIRRELRG